ncbi:bifunctional serine/threonine-protein kinase/formylglycine-generating enzyme family protein [Chloroflexota bacterium]
MPLNQGQVINERYRIAKQLGANRYGPIYRAWDLTENRAVALREIAATAPSVSSAIAQRLAVLRRVQHPNLPAALDVFSLPGQGVYLVSEFVEGQNLADKIAGQGGPLAEAEVLPWVLQVCDALIYLHSLPNPLIHGDLKPANILIVRTDEMPQGQVLLMDVGLGWACGFASPADKAPVYTPGFSPPEAHTGGALDARSEVYSLGASLYAALSGTTPGDSLQMANRQAPSIRALRMLNPAVSPGISAAVERATSLDRLERFESIAAFKAILEGRPAAGAAPVGTRAPAPAQPRRRTWLWLLVLLLLGAILVVCGILGVPYLLDFIRGDEAAATATATNAPTNTLIASATLPPESTATSEPTDMPESSATPGTLFVDQAGVSMLLVSSGAFEMGSVAGAPDEMPVHRVTLDDFYIDKYEVTNALYADCVAANACDSPLDLSSATRTDYYNAPEFADYPVVYVSWTMAVAYCEWRDARLPTEAEWEKAARGEGSRTFPWGDDVAAGLANSCQEGSECLGDTTAVGSYADGASPYGLLDLAGNVWEWVMDWYSDGYYAESPALNPLGPGGGDLRVLRGGAFNGGLLQQRATTRGRNLPIQGYNYVGFRCALTP